MSELICIIPARGGSKRIPEKNKKKLAGKPLLSWTIDVAKKITCFDVVVSTDNEAIATLAKEAGAKVPLMRSPEYATDTSTIVEAVIELLDYYEHKGYAFDAVLLLQPTSPFRTEASIRQAIDLYEQGDGESVISVSPAIAHPFWCKKIEHGTIVPFCEGFDDAVRSQDLPKAYQLNGSIYLSSVNNLRKNSRFYSRASQALIIASEEEALDIDTPFDWAVAEAVAQSKTMA